MDTFDNTDYWKSIIQYGLNTATYKIALGKTLLDLSKERSSTLSWHTLSKAFLDNYQAKLTERPMPQQVNPVRLTIVERIVVDINSGKLSYEQAINEIGRNAFNDVIPRFHTIGTNKELVKDRFYEVEFGKTITLKDELLMLNDAGINSLYEELAARWNLLEGAFSIKQTHSVLQNDDRLIYLQNGYARTPLTDNIPFLSAYQGDCCFYCGEKMQEGDIHVDHVLPRQVVYHDEIWNLVLAHSFCNESKSDRLVGDYYMLKLIARNENIIGSNHPWKQKIQQQLGSTPKERKTSLTKHYDTVKTVLGAYYWGGLATFTPEQDPFYKKLITRLNNG